MFSIVICARSESADYYMITSSNPDKEEAEAEVRAQFENFSSMDEPLEVVDSVSVFLETEPEVGFVCFIEYNEHEGETWYTFVKSNNQLIPEYVNALGMRSKYPDMGIITNEGGQLKNFSKSEVGILCNLDNTHYMEEYAIKELKPIDYSIPIDEFMYKRGCFK